MLSKEKQRKNRFCGCLNVIKKAFASKTLFKVTLKGGADYSSKGISDATTAGHTFCNTQTDLTQANMIGGRRLPTAVGDNLQGQFNKIMDFPNGQRGAVQREEYVFKFIQRQQFMQKKLAPQQSIQSNSLTVNNIKVVSIISSQEVKVSIYHDKIQYCEGLNGNLFLLKYFKFECYLCSRLCSHILIADCCKAPICQSCTEDIVEHYRGKDRLQSCLFCNKACDSKNYLVRDPMYHESKELIAVCLNKQKMAMSQASKIIGEQDHSIVGLSPSKDESMIKPQRLDFMSDNLKIMNTDSSIKSRLRHNVYGDSFLQSTNKKQKIRDFDDVIMNSNSSESPNEVNLRQTEIPLSHKHQQSHLQYSQSQYTTGLSAHHHLVNVQTTDSERQSQEILMESKPQQPFKHMAGRKRVNNKVKGSSRKKQSLNGSLSDGAVNFQNRKAQNGRKHRGLKVNNENFDSINSTRSIPSDSDSGIRRSSRQIKK